MGKRIGAVLALVAVGALAACSNNSGFGSGTGGAGTSGQTAGATTGGANDPSSPAYFQSTVGDRVLFSVDQSTLSDTSRNILTAQARWLGANPDFSAIIEGHADEQGTREYNLALGARRANAVQEYLISQGVAGERLRTVTFGKERPLEVCSQEACYAKNRRAVTVLQSGGAGF